MKDNLEICLKNGLLACRGLTIRRMEKFRKNDLIIFYVSKDSLRSNQPVKQFDSAVRVIGEISETSSYFASQLSGGRFPVNIPVEVISTKKCSIMPMIEQLEFIKNKDNWGTAFLGGVRAISVHDYNLIVQSMQ